MSIGRKKFEPRDGYTTDEYGWKEPATGWYVGPDGTEFEVPAVVQNTTIGGEHRTYGAYTSVELEAFWKKAKEA